MINKSNNELQKLEDAARAAWLYYVAKNTQDDIAAKLEVSRQSVQRLIALAVSEGLVQVRLMHPVARCMDLAEQLKTKFGLLECEVAPSDAADVNASHGVAQLGAQILERYLKSKEPKIFAFGTGRSIKACIDELPTMDCQQHKLVSLVGNIMADGSASKYDTVISMANRVNAKHYPLPLPLFAQSKEEKQLLLNLAPVQSIFKLAKQADVTFVGIGHMARNSPLLLDGFISQQQLDDLRAADVKGEIISWPFDSNGTLYEQALTDHLLSVPLEKQPERLIYGVAAGMQKVSAIHGALKGKLINGLITNEYTAEQIMKMN